MISRALGDARAWCITSLHASWREPSLCLRAAATALELPLRPSPRLRRVRWCLQSVIVAYVVELALEGHLFAAMLAVALSVAGFWPGRVDPWRRMRVEPDGQLFLLSRGGTRLEVRLEPGALRLGQHLLLVLRSDVGRHRLLLGPDNLAAGQLAALKRRLPG